ncbi:MAG: signal peptide peptidase SppA [Pseudomonadota bacterium]
MNFFLILVFFVFFLSPPAFSKEELQTGTSVSHFYDARSVFTNPAALAFQKELNGPGLLSSVSWGWREHQDDFGLALGWGGLGFGIESLATHNFEKFNKYSLASSVSLTPWLFVGSRLGLTTNSPSLEGVTELDLGLQIRPSSVFALGFLANKLNRPTQNKVELDSQYIFGITLRPIDRLLFFADLETQTTGFGNNWNYQGTISFEMLRGVYLQAGYDKTERAHFGVQLNLGSSSLYTTARTQKSERVLISHAQFAPFEKPSVAPTYDSLQLRINSSLRELGEPDSLFSSGSESFSELVLKIKDAEIKPEVKAIFIELDTFPLGMGAAHELFETLWHAREKGKTIHVALGNARLKEYLIASAAHSISVAPSGSLEWLGPKSERYYLKGTLDKVGIKAEMISKGAYKSAPETFTSARASEKSRENIFQNLQDAEKEIRECIQRSGRVTDAVWNQARKLGVLSARNAQSLKLIDQVQDAKNYQEKLLGSFRLGEDLKTGRQNLSIPPKIALVIASGDIVREKMKVLGLLGGDQITPEQMTKQLDQVKKDKTIKAVVLRISSGGGDVLASHLIASQIQDLSRIKPVVISMGDVAASGGYFISAPSTAIYSSPLTVTGSIGVFTGKPNLASLYKKLDLNKEILSQTPYSGLFSESREWSKKERAIVERQVEEYYQNFIQFVSDARKISFEKMDSLAQGRVFLGNRAREGKLVDGVGGLQAAFEEAQRRAGITDFSVKLIYPPSKFLDSLSDLMFVKHSASSPILLKDSQLLEIFKPGLISDKPFLYWSGDSIR